MSLENAKRRILSRVVLADVIGESVTLQKRSGRPVGRCPFHEEKTPSFYIFDDRYFCFGCKASGDVIDFVRKQKGLSFVETLRFLASKYGIEAPELDERSSWDEQKKQEFTIYYQLMIAAQEYFASNLGAPRGEIARNYLIRRGFTKETTIDYGFGLTPEKPWELSRFLTTKGYKQKDLETCSLSVTSTQDGRPFDFFRNRIMIPIRDMHGRIIAFGGRTTDNNPAKYINSRETPLFSKSFTLFGFDRAREVIRKQKSAVLVEGYMDVLKLWQSGFTQTVACLGTALTVEHLRILKSCSEHLTLLFDGDSAGSRASLATVAIALQVPEIRVDVAVLPQGEDPDTFVMKYGEEKLSTLLANSTDLLDFAITSRLKETHQLGIPDLVSRVFVPWLLQIPDRVQRGVLLNRLSQFTGIPFQQLDQYLSNAAQKPPGAASNSPQDQKQPSPVHPEQSKEPPSSLSLEPWEFELLAHIFFAVPGQIDTATIKTFLKAESNIDSPTQSLFAHFLDLLDQNIPPSSQSAQDFVQSFHQIQGIHDSLLIDIFNKLKKFQQAFSSVDRKKALETLILMYRRKRLKEAISTLKGQVASVSSHSEHNPEDYEQLLRTITELNKELVSLEERE